MRFRLPVFVTVILLFLCVPMTVLGQEVPDDLPVTPVGYSSASDVTDITRYRLPSWTFTTVTLDFDAATRRWTRSERSSIGGNVDRDDRRSVYNFSASPGLLTSTESEDRHFEFRVSSDIDVAGGSAESDRTVKRNRVSSDLGTALDVGLDWNEYVAGNLFLAASGDYRADYNRSHTDVEEAGVQVADRTFTRVVYDSNTRLGIGFGRIRDVTPVIRALRVRERLNRLGRQDAMDADEVQEAARQFARRPAYGPVYDRPDKYFWNDFFSRVDGANAELQPHEVFYVAEALQEPVARRSEGYEVAVGIDLNYQNELERQDDEFAPDDRRRTLRHSYGPFLRAEYVTNLNLGQQVSVSGDAFYTIPTDDESALDRLLSVTTSARWLWEIADRYRVNTVAEGYYRRSETELISTPATSTLEWWEASLESNLTIFLENRLALTAGVGASYGRSTTENEATRLNSEVNGSNLFVNLRLRYFLFRSLSI